MAFNSQLAKMLGNYIKECRRRSGLSQIEVAKLLGFSSQFYGRIEKGAVFAPEDSLITLISALDMHQDIIERMFRLSSVAYVDYVFTKAAAHPSKGKLRVGR